MRLVFFYSLFFQSFFKNTSEKNSCFHHYQHLTCVFVAFFVKKINKKTGGPSGPSVFFKKTGGSAGTSCFLVYFLITVVFLVDFSITQFVVLCTTELCLAEKDHH